MDAQMMDRDPGYTETANPKQTSLDGLANRISEQHEATLSLEQELSKMLQRLVGQLSKDAIPEEKVAPGPAGWVNRVEQLLNKQEDALQRISQCVQQLEEVV